MTGRAPLTLGVAAMVGVYTVAVVTLVPAACRVVAAVAVWVWTYPLTGAVVGTVTAVVVAGTVNVIAKATNR